MKRALTDKQLRVVELLAEGMTHKQISEYLGISVNTVNDHGRAARARLGTKNKVETVAVCVREGWLL